MSIRHSRTSDIHAARMLAHGPLGLGPMPDFKYEPLNIIKPISSGDKVTTQQRGNEQWQGVDEDIRRMENGEPPVGGWDEWAKHQRPGSDNDKHKLDEALGRVRND